MKFAEQARAFIIFGCAAVAIWKLIFERVIFGGYPNADNFEFNIPWAVYFLEQFSQGDLYPRWLTEFAYGIGAPIFYFYGPAPFYPLALTYNACVGCNFEAALALWHFAIYLLPAVAFYFWSRSFCGRALSMLCAALYVVLPYHLIDLEWRGSLGEALAYAFTPLVLLGIRRAGESGKTPLLAGVAYAGLIFSHLPAALLFTPILAVYAFITAPERGFVRALRSLSATGLIGVLLAAAYLIPALTLRVLLLPDGWVTPFGTDYEPSTWLYFSQTPLTEGGSASRTTITTALAIPTVLAAASVALLIIVRLLHRDGDPLFRSSTARHMAAAALGLSLCWVMMTDLVGWLYVHVDAFRQVQFPWRIGTVIDLMSATIVMIAASRIAEVMQKSASRVIKIAANAALTISASGVAFGLLAIGGRIDATERGRGIENNLDRQIAVLRAPPSGDLTPQQLFSELPVEYRTKWVAESRVYQQGLSAGNENAHVGAYRYWRAAVLAKPEAWVEGDASDSSIIALVRGGPTSFSVSTKLERPAEIGLRRAYFPNWRLIDAESGARIELRARESDGLMAFDAPAGEKRLLLRTKPLPAEVAGAALSAATLIVLAMILALRRYRSLGKIRVTWPIFRPGSASRLP